MVLMIAGEPGQAALLPQREGGCVHHHPQQQQQDSQEGQVVHLSVDRHLPFLGRTVQDCCGQR